MRTRSRPASPITAIAPRVKTQNLALMRIRPEPMASALPGVTPSMMAIHFGGGGRRHRDGSGSASAPRRRRGSPPPGATGDTALDGPLDPSSVGVLDPMIRPKSRPWPNRTAVIPATKAMRSPGPTWTGNYQRRHYHPDRDHGAADDQRDERAPHVDQGSFRLAWADPGTCYPPTTGGAAGGSIAVAASAGWRGGAAGGSIRVAASAGSRGGAAASPGGVATGSGCAAGASGGFGGSSSLDRASRKPPSRINSPMTIKRRQGRREHHQCEARFRPLGRVMAPASEPETASVRGCRLGHLGHDDPANARQWGCRW